MKDDIANYLTGKLSQAEMHALERKALNDPFLAEALEGAGLIQPEDFATDLNAIRQQLASKTRRKDSGFLNPGWPLRIAAGLLLLAVTTYLIFLLAENSAATDDTLALKKDTKHESPTTAESPLPEKAVNGDVSESAKSEEKSQAERKALINPSAPVTDQQSVAAADHRGQELGAGQELAEEMTIAEAPPAETQKTESAEVETEVVSQAPVSGYADVAQPQEEGEEKTTDERYSVHSRAATSVPAAQSVAPTSFARKQGSKIVTGKVVDDDGAPIPGVNVVIKETNISTVTDIEGNYTITLPDPKSRLIFSFIGFTEHEVPIEDIDVVDVRMSSDIAQLSEVVVEGDSEGKKLEGVTWDLARPAGGHKAYYAYLEQNLVYPQEAIANKIEGKVTVRFSVEPTGLLSDFRVVKSLGYGCDEEVIRLIKEGPRWSPTKRNNEPVLGRVRVKLKFRMRG